MNETVANPFEDNDIQEVTEAMPISRDDVFEDALTAKVESTNPMPEAEPAEEAFNMADAGTEVNITSTNPYPFINATGDMKLGLSIMLEEESGDSIFGDEEKVTGVLIIDSETGKSIQTELSFEKDSLNAKNKNISEEVFNNLSDVRKTVSLSKAFKNLMNTQYKSYKEITTSKEAITILERTIKKTAETSKNMKAKINENTLDDLNGVLTEYQFKKHLLITGDAGQGKTFIVDKHIKDSGLLYVQENGHQGLEAIDLIGHMIKLEDGSFGWKDGSLSEAFRLATAGTPVVYFIDEMLRIPARELNILVGSLTPNSDGELKLRTNRPMGTMDGIVSGEEITIPQNMLWVIATTNQGSGYQSSRIDEALKDRFRLFYQEMSAEKTQDIITSKYKKHKASPLAVKALVSMIQKTEEIKETGNIPRAFTIRHLSEAVDTAKNLVDVKRKMLELVPNIVSIDSDGKFNKEQVEIVRALIKKVI